MRYRRMRMSKAAGAWFVPALGLEFPSLSLAIKAIDRLYDGASRR